MISRPQQPLASMKLESNYENLVVYICIHCCTVEHSDVHLGVAVTLHTPESYNKKPIITSS